MAEVRRGSEYLSRGITNDVTVIGELTIHQFNNSQLKIVNRLLSAANCQL